MSVAEGRQLIVHEVAVQVHLTAIAYNLNAVWPSLRLLEDHHDN